MKKRLLKSLLLLFALIVGSGTMWGQSTDGYTATSDDKPTATSGTTTGTVSGTNGISWSYSVTQSPKSGKSPYVAFSEDSGWQLGSGNSTCTAFSISTSGISGTITQIDVVTGSKSASSKISVTVGGNAFGTQNQSSGSGATVATQTFTGSASGEIVISASASTAAFYFKSVTVTYTTGGGSTTYSVTYDGNGSDSGSVPTDNTAYSSGATVTVLGNTGSLAKTGYSFGGWNTQNDGQGTNYTEGNTFAISANTTLYAKWTSNAAATTTTIDATSITNTNVYAGTAAGSLSASVTSGGNAVQGATVTWSGNNDAVATINASGVVTLVGAGTVTFTASYAGVTNQYQASSDTYVMNVTNSAPYVRVSSLDYLTNNAKVIIAARYNTTTTSYYAMTAATSNKPAGVSFTSTTSNNGEVLPSSIVNSESTYSWTVGVTTSNNNTYYTFKNSNLNYLGYTSSTNFATNGDNTEWVIVRATSGSDAMVSGYEGFYITNKNNSGRGVALNNSHNYGPYATSNNNSVDYNFYVDIFVQGVTPASDPSITAEDVNITYNGTSGSISYTLNNSKTGGEVTAAITSGNTGNWLSIGNPSNSNANGTVALTCVANTGVERTATVTLTYTYDTDKTVTKEVTVTQAGDPNYVPTIFEVRAQGTGSVTTKGIVTSCVGTTGYIQDANAAICVFGTSLTVGNEIKVSGTLSTYSGLLEITNPTIHETISTGNTVTPEVMTIAEVNASTKQGWLVTIEDATVSAIDGQNVTIAQSNNTIVVRFSATPDNFSVNDVITLTGNIGCYSNTPQIANPTDVSVTVNNDPIITPASFTVEATATTDLSGTINVTYENITTVAADVAFYASDGTTSATYNWLTATINASNNLEYTLSVNTSTTARTAYLKVWAYDDELNEVYSNLITVTQAGVVVDYATLPFSFTGGLNDISSTLGLTNNNLGSDYADSDSKLKFNNTGVSLTLKLNEAPGVVSFNIKGNSFSGGTFKVQGSANNNDDYEDLASYGNNDVTNSNVRMTITNIPSTVRYIKWIFTEKVQNGGNIGIGKIVVEKPTVTLNASGYATYTSNSAIDYSQASGYTAWAITSISGTAITFYKVTGAVPAGTGVLLMGSAGQTVAPVATTSGTAPETNLLEGITIATAVENNEYYGLSGSTFVKVNPGTVKAGKALLPVSALSGSSARAFTFVFVDPTTGITETQNVSAEEFGAIFNLAGQRVSQPQRGVNIINGKKVLVK